MKLLLFSAAVVFSLSVYGQGRRFADIEVFAGANVTGRLTTLAGLPHFYNDISPMTPGLGWQAGALVRLPLSSAQRSYFKTGLTLISRQYSTARSDFSPTSTANPGGSEWRFNQWDYQFVDLELPLFFAHEFSISKNVRLAPTIGVIPGWRLSETFAWRGDVRESDGTQTVTERTGRYTHDQPGPFNRFNLYVGLQWQYTHESGRTITVEPNVRVNVLPLVVDFTGAGADRSRPGSEVETYSFGLNVGFLLQKRPQQNAGVQRVAD